MFKICASRGRFAGPAAPQFGRNHSQHGKRWGIFFKYDVSNAGIPNPGQEAGVLPGYDYEALGLRLKEIQVFRLVAIQYDDAA